VLRRRLVPPVLGLLTAVALTAAPAAQARTGAGTPGADGLGDRLYPQLGNGGYDAEHYRLKLRYPTGAPTETITGEVRMRAKATQSLSRLNLDYAGTSVEDVDVNRRDATFAREGHELVITPARTLRKGRTFVVEVAFTMTPTPVSDDPTSTALFSTPTGSAMAAQPDLAHFAYPSNDHPRDKARYTTTLDVPTGLNAVASGVLADTSSSGGRTKLTYVMRQPLASELMQLGVGGWDLIDRGRHDGVHVRDLTAPSLTAFVSPFLALEVGHLDWMRDRVGRYPFGTYGSFVVDEAIGFALETQTLSIFDAPWFTEFPQGLWEPTMIHEIAHQWFGDDVSPWEWSDLWLNEGHATWYELLFADERGFILDDTGFDGNFEELMQALYGLGDQFRQDFGPVAAPRSGAYEDLFTPQQYFGGALVLYALRQEIGEDDFDRLQRRWVRRFSGESVSTADFIAFASRIADRDLSGFLEAWLYGDTTPEMPGHPDWVVDPPQPRARAQAIGLTGGALAERRRR
jgi:aminopeptidase N